MYNTNSILYGVDNTVCVACIRRYITLKKRQEVYIAWKTVPSLVCVTKTRNYPRRKNALTRDFGVTVMPELLVQFF